MEPIPPSLFRHVLSPAHLLVFVIVAVVGRYSLTVSILVVLRFVYILIVVVVVVVALRTVIDEGIL